MRTPRSIFVRSSSLWSPVRSGMESSSSVLNSAYGTIFKLVMPKQLEKKVTIAMSRATIRCKSTCFSSFLLFYLRFQRRFRVFFCMVSGPLRLGSPALRKADHLAANIAAHFHIGSLLLLALHGLCFPKQQHRAA